MNNFLKYYEINSPYPEFDFIMNALQDGVRSGDIKITKAGFEDLLNKLEHSLEFEDISIYLENTYAESEYNRGFDDGYKEACDEHEFD